MSHTCSGNEVLSIRVRFHPYELDPDSGEIWKEGSPVRLQPQPAKVLCLLVEKAGNLVSREEIQSALWQGETFVDFDQGLNYCIRQIRVALEDSAEQPRFVATVPRRGYRFIAEVNPVYPTGSGPSLVLSSGVPPAEGSEARTSGPGLATETRPELRGIAAAFAGLRGSLLLGATALVLLGGLVIATRHKHLGRVFVSAASEPTKVGKPGIPSRTSVAVLGFENLGGKNSDAWLSTALSEMLSTELAQGEKLRLVSGEEVARARRVVPLPASLAPETLGRLRQQLGADLIVLGSYAVLPNGNARKIRLDLRLQDARNGQTLASFSQTGNEAELFSLVSNTGVTLRQKLGIGALSATQETAFDQSFPFAPDARRFYAEGLDRLRRFDALGARELLEQVVSIEPKFAPAHSALAGVWSTLGYDGKAADEAKKAVDLAAGLSREEQLSIEARYYEMAQDWRQATETLRSLVAFFPDNLDYGVRLANVQQQADQKTEALATLAKLRKLPEPLGNSPRLDILEAQILDRQGDFKEALKLSEQAVRKSKTIGAPFLLTQALIRKASDLERLGSPDSALETISESKHAATDAGYSKGVGISLLIGGNVLYNKGDYPAARALYENALSIFQDTGDKRNQGMALEGIGNSYHDQGKFAESQNEYTRALEAYREAQWLTGISSATGNLANTLDSLGDPKSSLGMHQEALQVFEQIGNKRAIASEVNNIAVVQQETGNLQAAADGHRKSIALHRQTGYQTGEMYGLSGLGDVLLVQGNFDAARKQYELARTLGGKIQEADQSARSDIQIATIDLLQDRYSEAEARLRRSATQFQQGKDPEGSALAYAGLTRVLLAEKKNAEAIEAGRQAKNYAGQITSLPPQFEVDLALADLEAATGEKDTARKRLLASLDRARRSGYTQYVLEARRELIGLETGKMRETHLSALVEESRQKGFGLVVTEIARMPKSSIASSQVAER